MVLIPAAQWLPDVPVHDRFSRLFPTRALRVPSRFLNKLLFSASSVCENRETARRFISEQPSQVCPAALKETALRRLAPR